MPLITVTELRSRFDISPDIADSRLLPILPLAARRLRGWVSEADYADALLVSPVSPERKNDLQIAEGHLAMHFALLGLNSPITPKGVVKTAKVEGDTVLSYLTPREVAELRQLYLEIAEEMVRPYRFLDDVPDSGFGFSTFA